MVPKFAANSSKLPVGPRKSRPDSYAMLANLFSSRIMAVQAQHFCVGRLFLTCLSVENALILFLSLSFFQCKQNCEWGKMLPERLHHPEREENKLPHRQLNLQREHDMWRFSPLTSTHANYPGASSVVWFA